MTNINKGILPDYLQKVKYVLFWLEVEQQVRGNMKNLIVILFVLFQTLNIYCQNPKVENKSQNLEIIDSTNKFDYFVGYGLGEMAFNKFQNFSGEMGVKFQNHHMLRFVYNNIKATEEHLSSDFASVVDGNNVRGSIKSYDLIYSLPVYKSLKLGGIIGYANDYYEHTILDESVENFSLTIGVSPGFGQTDLFKIIGFYYYFEIPIRMYFNPLEETKLGDSVVNRHFIMNNIWFFIGYQF